MAKKDWMVRESELDDAQLAVLHETLDKSCIVSGCAGSGKSILALIKAQRIKEEKGDDYEIIVFTKALCRYMNAGRETLGLKNIYYHWEWVNRMHKPSADYVIVDEIQDFTKDEICDFIKAARKNFFFYGDTAQSIYDGLKDTLGVDDICYLFHGTGEFSSYNRPKQFNLYKNYRLSKPVAKMVQYVGIDIDPYDDRIYDSKEGFKPRILRYNNNEEQINAIKEIITRRGLHDVAIMLPHNNDVEIVSNMLNNIGVNHEVKYSNSNSSNETLNFNTDNPKVMTYHSAKGLQFETVFLPCVTTLTNDSNRIKSEQKALYVAMTRTYRHLYIMYSGQLHYPLSNIPQDLYETTDIPQQTTTFKFHPKADTTAKDIISNKEDDLPF